MPRYLNVNLVHTLEHASVVCCVKFSADGRYLAAGCNRKTYIYDVKTAQQIRYVYVSHHFVQLGLDNLHKIAFYLYLDIPN